MFFVNLLISSVGGALALLFLFYKKHRLCWNRQSKIAAFGGAAAFALYLIFCMIFESFDTTLGAVLGETGDAVYRAALEELLKIIPVAVVIIRYKNDVKPTDIPLYGALSATSAAILENAAYMLDSDAAPIMRALMSVPGHIYYTCLFSLFIVMAIEKKKKGYIVLGFLIASATHALYNISLDHSVYTAFLIYPILMYSQLWRFLRLYTEYNPFPKKGAKKGEAQPVTASPAEDAGGSAEKTPVYSEKKQKNIIKWALICIGVTMVGSAAGVLFYAE